MKIRTTSTIVIIFLFLFSTLLTGCAGKNENAIEMYVDDYGYAFSLLEISQADNGNTVVEIIMKPFENKDGDKADLNTAINDGSLFLIETYMVSDDKDYEYNENSEFALKRIKKNMDFVYKYEFDTDQQPDLLYFYPANKRDDADYHWQIDPKDGSILKEAAIIED